MLFLHVRLRLPFVVLKILQVPQFLWRHVQESSFSHPKLLELAPGPLPFPRKRARWGHVFIFETKRISHESQQQWFRALSLFAKGGFIARGAWSRPAEQE